MKSHRFSEAFIMSEWHAWRNADVCMFATFVYAKSPERLPRHFTGPDENEVIRQALVWCEKNS